MTEYSEREIYLFLRCDNNFIRVTISSPHLGHLFFKLTLLLVQRREDRAGEGVVGPASLPIKLQEVSVELGQSGTVSNGEQCHPLLHSCLNTDLIIFSNIDRDLHWGVLGHTGPYWGNKHILKKIILVWRVTGAGAGIDNDGSQSE